MTAGGFSEVDHDLLAEYAGGALEPARAAQVERLLRDDPRWQRAYRETVVALEAVTARLAAYGAAAPPMPPEVLARLTGALAAAGPVESAGPARDRGAPGRAARRRRWARLSAPVAVAAAALAVVGLGLGQWRTAGEDASSPGDAAAQVAPPVADRLIASGRDYTAATLALGVPPADAVGVPPLPTAGASLGPEAAPEPGGPRSSVGVQTFGSPLDRLREQGALSSCLSAIGAAHQGDPVTVGTVDYAAFEGAPALIVELVDGRGERWAYAAGPACGLGSDADVRLRTRVG